MNRIEVVKQAIEFKNPPYIPIELVDVPGIYSAYFTLDPEKVEFIEGMEDFDSLWLGYSWSLTDLGKNENDEPLRKDEWGVVYKVPNDESSAYVILEHPLKDDGNLDDYIFPNPKVAEPFFLHTKRVIKERYHDRFINGYIDPGAFLIAFSIMGYENLLIKLIDNLSMVKKLIERIFEFQKEIVRYFKAIGAHMITIIDEIAGTGGLMFSPTLFRKEFFPFYRAFFSFVRSQNLYTGILFDGNVTSIVDDILSMDTDCVQFMEPNTVGLQTIVKHFKGKRCIKTSVDMRKTLAVGTPSQVEAEAHSLVKNLHTDKGGYIPIVLRWYRPVYPDKNVQASVKAFNCYRGRRI